MMSNLETTMKAVVIQEPGAVAVQDVSIPEPLDDEVQIQVKAAGICGTDIHIFHGEYLGDYPIIPGHEFAGVVTSVGRGVSRHKIGDRVAVEPNIACNNCYPCLHNRQNFCVNWEGVGVTRPGGMAEYTTAPEENVFSIGELSFDLGALVEPLSCVLHGVQRLSIDLADRVLIIGAGPIGNLLLQTIRLQGAGHVVVVDKNRSRAQETASLGADEVLYRLDDLPRDHFDAVIDATGVLQVMSRTTEFVRHGGRILLFGVPPAEGDLCLPAFAIFRKGLTILSSYTSRRNSFQAIRLLEQGLIKGGAVISHKLSLDEFLLGVTHIENGVDNVKKVLLIPGL
jgi:D-arabinitol dehydrogenase (NADP+)